MDTLDPHHSPEEQPIRRLLERALQRARGSILWERLWPAVAALAVVAGLFLAFSWAGLWLVLPPLGRAVGLFLFLIITLAATIPLALLRIPTINEGLRRLDRGSGERHRPATAIADEIAGSPSDPVTQALWRAHVERALLSARRLKAGWPKPYLSARDPVALRALVLILVVATFFAAGGERIKRVTAAFDWHGVVVPANFRIDAWVNPPLYTGRPPIMLSGLRSGEAVQKQTDAIAVPTGSELVVRGTGQVRFDVVKHGGLEDAKADNRPPVSKGTVERRLVIKGDGSATLHGAGSDLVWNFTAIPDKPPTIDLIRDPERQARGSLRLDYRVTDDYGVTQAQATFTRKDQPGAGAPPHPLFKAPEFALSLPGSRARAGTAQTTHDLTAHPWAGADVVMTLIARDQAGNEGRSGPHELTLPERIFTKPVARALIEQRRNLALDANTKPIVLTALDALTLAPEKFTPNVSIYLGLRSIYFDLLHARSDDALREVVARMWDMAVQIEDGNMSQTEQALRQAQEALRQALERNAPDEEIKRLMQQLRAALDKFLQALAEQMKRNPQQLARPLDRNTRVLSERDLQNLIDRMENMARSGNKEAARRLLDRLQSMLENLQMAQPNMGQQGDDDMMSALDELGDMIRKQQQLRDRTFKQGQDSRRNQQQGQRRQFGDLRQHQQQLHQRLQQLLEQLRKNGLGQQMPGQKGQGQNGQKGQKGQKGQGRNEMGQLGDAGKAMGEAEGQLGQGDADNAVDSQGRALEAMRKGAQGLAQQMQQSGMGPGPGQPGRGRARAQQNTDPLGRPMRGRQYGDDLTVKVPGEIDAQRARRILEELRKRLADPSRPQLELDYIERLLQGF
ncbi:MAG TPA: TIGR02302 family protein [Pseudolabrys sp.]|nr:TIGR02302 family protein [Pseudolabrys sp.]